MVYLRNNVKIIQENDNYLVVYKPSYLPTVPLKNDNKLTLLSIVGETYPDVLSFKGYSSWENGVLHRLDTNTSGLVLIARNKLAFDYLIQTQKDGEFLKEYKAISSKQSIPISDYGSYPFNDPAKNKDIVHIKSLFRYYGKGRKQVLPVLDSYSKIILKKATGPLYETDIKLVKEDEYIYEFRCILSKGFKHQVRTHMAWSGHPLLGDELYGGLKNQKFGLEAIGLSFLDPKTEEKVEIKYIEKQEES